MNKNIFVACDVSSQKEILDLLSKIHKEISGIKIGLQYITKHSLEDIKELGKFNKPLFYDGKFFDIKNTLVESIKSLEELKISYATVHLLNGLDALKAANEAAAVAEDLAQQQQQAQDTAQALAHIIYFDFDQSTIKAEFRTALNGHAAYLSQNPSASIVLEGHADERGTREYNIALGERRGNAVSRYLVVQGVSIDAIEVVSFGEERPVNAGNDSASWSENRRVEIRYINY